VDGLFFFLLQRNLNNVPQDRAGSVLATPSGMATMREEQARKHLEKMLRSFTPGSVLNLLADLYRQEAEEARRENNMTRYQQCRLTESTLIVVGMGLDGACPR
jgi:hypothetical protein